MTTWQIVGIVLLVQAAELACLGFLLSAGAGLAEQDAMEVEG